MNTLAELAALYQVEKALPFLNYPPLYDEIFTPIRQRPIRLLEIGVQRGLSLRMWYDYFPNAQIFGYDIARWSKLTRIARFGRDRVFVFSGDQSSKEDLNKFIEMYGSKFDVIIDDGSHLSEHQFITLETLFPHLKPGGMYFVEDLQASHSQVFRQGMKRWMVGEEWSSILSRNDVDTIRFLDGGEKLLLIERKDHAGK